MTVQDGIPVIDLAPLFKGSKEEIELVSRQIGEACERVGFFYISNHGVSEDLVSRLFSEGKRFFRQPKELKQAIHMRNSPVYRGWFELGGELTSRQPDLKEGLYFGAELPMDHPKVQTRTPMHGPNQWPPADTFPGFDRLILDYMEALTELGHTIMQVRYSVCSFLRQQCTGCCCQPQFGADLLPREGIELVYYRGAHCSITVHIGAVHAFPAVLLSIRKD